MLKDLQEKQKMNEHAKIIQVFLLKHYLKSTSNNKKQIEKNASIQIQSAFRCFLAKKSNKEKQNEKARVIQKVLRETQFLRRAKQKREQKIKEQKRNFLMQLSYKTRLQSIPLFFEDEMFCINAPINSEIVRMHNKNPDDLLGELMKMTPSELDKTFNFASF